jgi:hypothetical protein
MRIVLFVLITISFLLGFDFAENKFKDIDIDSKINAYVISLSSEDMSEFIYKWKKEWPNLNIIKTDGLITKRRGLGLTVIQSLNFESAYKEKSDHEYTCFLEDHAVPFKSKSFDDKSFHQRFMDLVKVWPDDSPILFLGGHAIKTIESPNIKLKITRIRMLAGTYGFVVRHKFLLELADLLKSDVYKDSSSYSPDVALSAYMSKLGSNNYIATPLLIDHKARSYSMTWREKRSKKMDWENIEDWWIIPGNVNRTRKYFWDS